MLTFYGLGMILGAGVYSIIGKAAGLAGESLWLGFILAAMAAALTALSYAELATLYPKAGAEYFFLKNAFPKKQWLATTIGVLMFFAGAATATTVAMAFAGYLRHFVEFPVIMCASGILIVFSVINLIGVRVSGWFNIVFTGIEIAGLILFITLGVTSKTWTLALTTPPTWGTLSSAALIIFAYLGFENIVNLSEETKDPVRTIPKAILLSMILATTLYVLVSLVAVGLITPEELANSQAPLVDAAAKHSRWVTVTLGATALFSTANTALIALITTSRILFGIANDGALPKIFAKLSSQWKTPWVATLAAMCISLLLLTLGAIEMVASVSAFATLVTFVAVNLALIVLRFKQPKLKRTFSVPLRIGRLPILPVLAMLICTVFLFQFSLQVNLVGMGCVLLALCFGLLWKHRG